MLRGAMIVFSAFISVPLLGKKLYKFHWFGVATCVIGITFVGVSNYLNTQAQAAAGVADSGPNVSAEESLMGVVLVLSAQVVQATQVVCEEKFLKEVNIPPFKIVGFEGVWGSLECIFFLFPALSMIPGRDDGVLEDTADTMVMLSNSGALQVLVLLYIFSCSTYNAAGMAVTSSFSAVHRTMLEASRTAVIWGFDLFVHYSYDPTAAFGEVLLPFSWLQLAGFLIVLSGQMVYGEIIRVPGMDYPTSLADDMEFNPSKFESPTQMMMSSPLPKDRD
jgi:drug/metabolite transporter (DMT)-like permease